jgi:hypothetical protein
MIDRAEMETSELEALEAAEAQAKADAINARATWRTMNHREEGKVLTPLWLALNQVSARVSNGVFDRATTLLETRETEMETRCESALEGWPRNSGPIDRRDAVAMQTITSSYVDALDQVSSVLDTMINTLIDQHHRAIENEAREASAVNSALAALEKELAPATENIAAMDADRIKSTGDRASELESAQRSHERLYSELSTVRTQLMACYLARANVLNYWRLALKLEAELAKIAH